MSVARRAVACPASAADALAALRGVPGEASVVLVDADASRVRVATMTAFGPSVWTSPRPGAGAAADILADVHRRGRAPILHAPSASALDDVVRALDARRVPADRPRAAQADDAAEAVAAFLGRAAEVPVSRTVDGGERAGAWAVAAYDDRVEIGSGERLALKAFRRDGSTVLRWIHPSGVDVGVALVLPRAVMTEAERAIVAGAWAEVTRLTYGLAPLDDGRELRTQVTMLDVPRSLLTAFPDGVRPRYGFFVEDHA